MDNAIDKIGIYDFFSCFLSGIIFVILCILSGIPAKYFFLQEYNDTIQVISFLLIGYFWGLILQGLGSLLDKQLSIPGFKSWASRNFLNETKFFCVFKDELERKEMQALVNTVLDNYISSYTPDIKNNSKCYNVYQHCVEYLQHYGKIEKSERINSTYGMLRSLMIATSLLLLWYNLHPDIPSVNILNFYCLEIPFKVFIKLLFFFFTIFFAIRSSSMAKYRVRVILREYKLLTTEKNTSNTMKENKA